MRKFLFEIGGRGIAWIGILAGVAQILATPFILDDILKQDFYATHPMLRAMRDAPGVTAAGERSSMTQILLNRVPRGTNRPDVIAIMSAEGLECNRPVDLLDRDRVLVCRADKLPCSASPWHIELYFDDLDHVTDGRASSQKAAKLLSFKLLSREATCEG